MMLSLQVDNMSGAKRDKLALELMKGIAGVISYTPKCIEVSGGRKEIEQALLVSKKFNKVR